MANNEALLEVKDLHCGYGKREIVHGLTFSIEQGEFVCIIGANGCGKSTLLKNLLHIDKPFSGTVTLGGEDVSCMEDKIRAQMFAYLPQEHTPPFPFIVGDVVLMGRTPYLGQMSQISDEDRRIAWDALCLLGIDGLAAASYTELSGGQRQLVLIARCLAQQPSLIIMDEPTASLDFGNQQIVLSRMKALTQSEDCGEGCSECPHNNMSVLMVTHDPHHAFMCADKVVVMHEGKLLDVGAPEDVMTKETLEHIYNTPVDVVDVKLSNGDSTNVCVPL